MSLIGDLLQFAFYTTLPFVDTLSSSCLSSLYGTMEVTWHTGLKQTQKKVQRDIRILHLCFFKKCVTLQGVQWNLKSDGRSFRSLTTRCQCVPLKEEAGATGDYVLSLQS